VTIVGYTIIARNGEILAIIIENGFFYNRIFTEPVEALKGNHYNGFKVIFASFSARKSIIVDLNVAIPFNLLSKTPFQSFIIIKSIPLDPCGDLLEPPGGVTSAFVQHVKSYYRPFKRALNYPKYKKDFDLSVHVQVFKATIKVNSETIYVEIVIMFNFTLRDNTYDWCNNYMRDNPNCRLANLE
jgi:hypothetical protein